MQKARGRKKRRKKVFFSPFFCTTFHKRSKSICNLTMDFVFGPFTVDEEIEK